MIYSLENSLLKVDISDLGAELQSIFSKKENHEYLYQRRKNHWVGKSPVLFPIVGKLYNGITKNGKVYHIPMHGFAKSKIFEVTNKTKTSITFTITETDKTLKQYPFKFRFNVIYTLTDNNVRMEFLVENTGNEILPFSVGGHPGFKTPLADGLMFRDHYLEFEKACSPTTIVLSGPYYSGKDVDFPLVNKKIIPLRHNLFDNDAIFLNDMCKTVTLKSDKTDRYVKVSAPKANHFGFWHDPKRSAPFICIEPWGGIPSTDGIVDDFSNKNEFNQLEPKRKYNYYIDITVKA